MRRSRSTPEPEQRPLQPNQARSSKRLPSTRIGQLRLHGSDGGRFQILDSKTETGIREVQMTPDLAAAVSEHIARLRRVGAPTGPKAFLVPNARGGRNDRGRIPAVLAKASVQASEQQLEGACRRYPTPHRTRCGAPTSRSHCSRTTST
jgi:hypothetical protein